MLNAGAIRLCPLASHRCRGSSGSTGISLWTSANARPFSLLEPIDERHQVFNLRRALKLGSHEQLPVLSGAATCPVFASTTSFRPSPVASSLTPPSLLDGMKDKVASLNASNAKTRLNFGSIIKKNCYESNYFPLSLKKAVDRTLHFDRFFSLRSEKTEDSRNGGKTHENKAVFFGKPLPA